jgi:hypothetical protein
VLSVLNRFFDFDKKFGYQQIIALFALISPFIALWVGYRYFNPLINQIKNTKPLLVSIHELQQKTTRVLAIKIRNDSTVPSKGIAVMFISDAYAVPKIPQPEIIIYPPAPYTYDSNKNSGTIQIGRVMGPNEELVVTVPAFNVDSKWYSIIDAYVYSEVGPATYTKPLSPTSSQKLHSYRCGNGTCEWGENQTNCPRDCGSTGYCGDDICNGMETAETCVADCRK